jgi:hypothetical protein
MINLTQNLRENGEANVFDWFFPDIYYAENLKDFNNYRGQFEVCPLKMFFGLLSLNPSTSLIFLNNINLSYIQSDSKKNGDYFNVFDKSGENCLMYWARKGVFYSGSCFDSCEIDQGLKRDDFVDRIIFSYTQDNDFCYILDVDKFGPSETARDETSTNIRIKRFIKFIPETAI